MTFNSIIDIYNAYSELFRFQIVAAIVATMALMLAWGFEGAWQRFFRLCGAGCLILCVLISLKNLGLILLVEFGKHPEILPMFLHGLPTDKVSAIATGLFIILDAWKSEVAALIPGIVFIIVLVVFWLPLVKAPIDYLKVPFFINDLRNRQGWLAQGFISTLGGVKVGLPIGRYPYWIFPFGLFPFGLFPIGKLLRYQPETGTYLGGHHMVIAGTRAGKGVSCVLPAIIDHNGPVIVIDIKGHLSPLSGDARARANRAQPIRSF